MRFEVFTAMSIMITFLWDVILCSLIEEGEVGTAGYVETLVPMYQTTQHHVPDNHSDWLDVATVLFCVTFLHGKVSECC
jgi:hypothetical protein